ncbi:MAG TPA: DUF4143 domain-containing protein [Clostridia bacterium]|nr:DUF4143 domain-containing protein [Clostridia bacterium]HQC68446.1 DUF4143 domain-containing protein [Clostridia bacterium]
MRIYKPRIVDRILEHRLRSKGAVLIEGAKWCGKTTTAMQKAKSMIFMQDPAQKEQNLSMARISPERLLRGEVPRLIDEWQLAPQLWDAVRFEVDKRDEFGQFILTGSATPADTSLISHTGTGRVTRMLMRPMSLYESGESNGAVSLDMLFKSGKKDKNTGIDIKGSSNMELDELAFLICRGGWPKAVCIDEEETALRQAIDYFDAVVSYDISNVDEIKRDEMRATRLLRSYARHIGSQAKFTGLATDLQDNEALTINPATVQTYVQALNKLFVLEDAPTWNPNLRSRVAIRTTDTRYFTDPSVAAAAMGIGPDDLIANLNTMGLFFENMVIRDLRIYAELLDGKVYHYRDKTGLECDAAIHLRNGQYGLIEIKLGSDRIEEGATTLKKLESILCIDKMNEPAFKMVIVGKAPYAYRRKDGILVVPIGCLGP